MTAPILNRHRHEMDKTIAEIRERVTNPPTYEDMITTLNSHRGELAKAADALWRLPMACPTCEVPAGAPCRDHYGTEIATNHTTRIHHTTRYCFACNRSVSDVLSELTRLAAAEDGIELYPRYRELDEGS